MFGLYIHIPYCRSKCRYCDFYSTPCPDGVPEAYIDALCREMDRFSPCGSTPLRPDTLYFGGGTPSLLTPAQAARLIRAAGPAPGAEITLEANPETVTPERLAAFRRAGVNRLSLGIQTARDDSLARLGRRHTAAQSRRALGMAVQAGFTDISGDLMLALPAYTMAELDETIALLAESGNNRPYIQEVFSPEELHPIADLPDLPKLERDGIQAATHFVESTLSVEPAAERAPFHGRIWVLVGPAGYSASESFAVFCQETGFATLVGSPTGGDGIGALDPVFLQLPNSGILVQFTMMFGLNGDGSSSEETGTTPDILSPAGEPALVTALRAMEGA